MGLACLGPGWMWVTCSHPRYAKLRNMMSRAPGLGGIAALVALFLGIRASAVAIQRDGNILEDLHSGPENLSGVVCTHFTQEVNTPGRGGDSGASMVVRYANGMSEEIVFNTAPKGTWSEGKGAEVEQLCRSGALFTLWRWPRTGVIADITSGG